MRGCSKWQGLSSKLLAGAAATGLLFAVASCSDDAIRSVGKLPVQEGPKITPVKPPPPPKIKVPIKEVRAKYLFQVPLDVLWVIDNSPSMHAYHQALVNQSSRFLQSIVNGVGVDWRMGLIFSCMCSASYVGFDPDQPLDCHSPDPMGTFVDAIDRFGDNGEGSAKAFVPIEKALNKYPSFLRTGSTLALLIATDGEEQSGNTVTPQAFVDYMKAKRGDQGEIFAAGLFGAQDAPFYCPKGDSPFNFSRSRYESLLSAMGGWTYPLCGNDLGSSLAALSERMIRRTRTFRVPLAEKPKLSTLVVVYEGHKLRPSTTRDDGDYFYDAEANTLVFPNLDFSVGDVGELSVFFDLAS